MKRKVRAATAIKKRYKNDDDESMEMFANKKFMKSILISFNCMNVCVFVCASIINARRWRIRKEKMMKHEFEFSLK